MSRLLLAFALTLVLVSAASAQYVYTSQDWQDGVGSWALFGTAGTTQPVLVNDAITNELEEGNIALKTMALASGTNGNARFELPLLATKTWQLTWDFYAVGGEDFHGTDQCGF